VRRRRALEEPENVDRWVVSYADFITLMFAFFTVMYAVSRVDSAKLSDFVGSTRGAFGSRAPAGKAVIDGIVPVSPAEAGLRRDADRILDAHGAGGAVSIRRDRRGLVLSMGEQVLFEPGRADAKQSSAGAISAVAAILRKAQCDAVVEGHTDSLPISNGRYASNWDLSAGRATAVLARLLEDHELPPARLAAAGYAEFRPVASNATPEGRARNRRVDVVLLLPGSGGEGR